MDQSSTNSENTLDAVEQNQQVAEVDKLNEKQTEHPSVDDVPATEYHDTNDTSTPTNSSKDDVSAPVGVTNVVSDLPVTADAPDVGSDVQSEVFPDTVTDTSSNVQSGAPTVTDVSSDFKPDNSFQAQLQAYAHRGLFVVEGFSKLAFEYLNHAKVFACSTMENYNNAKFYAISGLMVVLFFLIVFGQITFQTVNFLIFIDMTINTLRFQNTSKKTGQPNSLTANELINGWTTYAMLLLTTEALDFVSTSGIFGFVFFLAKIVIYYNLLCSGGFNVVLNSYGTKVYSFNSFFADKIQHGLHYGHTQLQSTLSKSNVINMTHIVRQYVKTKTH